MNNKNEKKENDVQECIKAQAEFCKQNKLPHFAPYDGRCWSCGRQIYGEPGYPLKKASSQLITGCPHCFRSYCD